MEMTTKLQKLLLTHFTYAYVRTITQIVVCQGKHLSVYPGETFQVSVFSTGQRNGTVPSQVRSHLSTGRLLSSQYTQQTAQTCTTLSYTVFSLQNVTLELDADGPCSTFGDKLVLLLNESQYCPPGFVLSLDENSCVVTRYFKNIQTNAI